MQHPFQQMSPYHVFHKTLPKLSFQHEIPELVVRTQPLTKHAFPEIGAKHNHTIMQIIGKFYLVVKRRKFYLVVTPRLKSFQFPRHRPVVDGSPRHLSQVSPQDTKLARILSTKGIFKLVFLYILYIYIYVYVSYVYIPYIHMYIYIYNI